uniref:ATP synthase F0 subunit 8 n=1 Tax=Priasilpha obscura TaxID=295936 RepID=B6D8X3_9CUCU|nr:ATP synthase F0 subunit 8 [Priasilpha obscura]ACF35111.1 ATP synthase F0 subunit 8 [Priasilpha obscura]
MPQMMPLSWLTLFIYFSLIFLMYNSMNYFLFIYPIKKFKFDKKLIQLSWKW